MALDARRKHYLKAMGVDLWVSKDAVAEVIESAPVDAAPFEVTPEVVGAPPLPVSGVVSALKSTPKQMPKPASEPVMTPSAQVHTQDLSVSSEADFFGADLPPLDAYDNEPPVEEEEGCFDDFLTPDLGVRRLSWKELEDRVSACTCCGLHKTRRKTVFGEGDRKAKVMFIGDAPGLEEDALGKPYAGKESPLLTGMLKAIGFQRDQVFISNILKCRPPQQRDSQAEEVRHCLPYLQRQIALVEPDVVVCLGANAVHHLLNTAEPLAALRGRTHTLAEFDIPVVVTYHPGYLLRNAREKGKAWQDLLYLKSLLSA